ncbi:MAG: PAS domain S-box protein, partial [bacterium]
KLSMPVERRVNHPDGSVRWQRWTSYVARDEAGHITEFQAVGRDITEQRRAEEEAARNQERMQAIINGALDVIVTADASGRILEWNPQAEATFGWTAAEVRGQRIITLVLPEEERTKFATEIGEFITFGRSALFNRRFELTLRRRSGDTFPAEVSVTPVPFGNSKVYNAFIRDITARKRAIEALERYAQDLEVAHRAESTQARRLLGLIGELEEAKARAEAGTQAKGAFLANISHEFRTPLNAILGYAEMMLDDSRATPELAEFTADLEHIRSAGKHLLELVSNILDVSKIEAGQMQVHKSTFPVRSLIEEVAALVRPLAREAGNALMVEIGPEVDLLDTDEVKLRQILLNLLGNACKFTSNGVILLSVKAISSATGPMLELAVRDTGIGIEPSKVWELFEEFTQGEPPVRRQHGGTGLGLTICRHYVQMLNGSIQVSGSPGQGARFAVSLPLASEPIRRPETNESGAGLLLLGVPLSVAAGLDAALQSRVRVLQSAELQSTIFGPGTALTLAIAILPAETGANLPLLREISGLVEEADLPLLLYRWPTDELSCIESSRKTALEVLKSEAIRRTLLTELRLLLPMAGLAGASRLPERTVHVAPAAG